LVTHVRRLARLCERIGKQFGISVVVKLSFSLRRHGVDLIGRGLA
jgi:hypothetical protein